jgi:hypothetical protein
LTDAAFDGRLVQPAVPGDFNAVAGLEEVEHGGCFLNATSFLFATGNTPGDTPFQ